MAILKTTREDFELNEFPETTDFTFKEDQYHIAFTEPEEIRMALYIRTVKVFKNGKLIKSFTTADPTYFSISTNDHKYLALPTKNGIEITNLENGNTAEFNIAFLTGNEFNSTNKYCVVNGYNEAKLIDLETLKVKYRFSHEEHYISQARFGFDNKLLMIDDYGEKFRIKLLDADTLHLSYSLIEKPFDFFKIPLAKYTKIIHSKKHCVWLQPNGGMRHSSFLNQWEYVSGKNKIIYKTLLPVSDVAFSTNYNVDSCNGEFVYVEIENLDEIKDLEEKKLTDAISPKNRNILTLLKKLFN